ncbi:MAG: OmpH family outer membrane protein [Rikenellaceae bacterium]
MSRVSTISIYILALGLSVSCNNPAPASAPQVVEALAAGDVVYVNVDEVLASSDIFLKEGIALQQRLEGKQAEWQRRQNELQAEAISLQDRYQRGLLSSSAAQSEQQKLESRVVDYQHNYEQESRIMDQQSVELTQRMQQMLQSATREVNSDGRYRLILDSSVLLDADTTLNISGAVLSRLNAIYAKERR